MSLVLPELPEPELLGFAGVAGVAGAAGGTATGAAGTTTGGTAIGAAGTATGAAGVDGFDGLAGFSGLAGLAGLPGFSGLPGLVDVSVDGVAGVDGAAVGSGFDDVTGAVELVAGDFGAVQSELELSVTRGALPSMTAAAGGATGIGAPTTAFVTAPSDATWSGAAMAATLCAWPADSTGDAATANADPPTASTQVTTEAVIRRLMEGRITTACRAPALRVAGMRALSSSARPQ